MGPVVDSVFEEGGVVPTEEVVVVAGPQNLEDIASVAREVVCHTRHIYHRAWVVVESLAGVRGGTPGERVSSHLQASEIAVDRAGLCKSQEGVAVVFAAAGTRIDPERDFVDEEVTPGVAGREEAPVSSFSPSHDSMDQ